MKEQQYIVTKSGILNQVRTGLGFSVTKSIVDTLMRGGVMECVETYLEDDCEEYESDE